MADDLPFAESVTFSVLCRTTRGRGGRPHPVTLHPDGTVETPHDLAAERVAAALGGYLTCLHLVDRYVPSLRDLMGPLLRSRPPGIERAGDARWRPTDRPAGCSCRDRVWADPGGAAAHLRDLPHWAVRHGVPVAEARRWYAQLEPELDVRPPVVALSDVVQESDGGEWLWEAGIHPDTVRLIHSRLGLDEPMRALTYLQIVLGQAPTTWLAPFARFSADTVTWAVATYDELDRRSPDDRRAWLDVGLGRGLTLELRGGPYQPADVRLLAQRTGLSPVRAGRLLAEWLAAGGAPTLDQLTEVCRLEVGRLAPNRAAIAELRRRDPVAAKALTDTDLGLVLVQAGTVPAAVSVLRGRLAPDGSAAVGAAVGTA